MVSQWLYELDSSVLVFRIQIRATDTKGLHLMLVSVPELQWLRDVGKDFTGAAAAPTVTEP